jgi:tetratricopeptide (TPR) repeat protein
MALKEKYKTEEMSKEEVVDLYTRLFGIVNSNIEGGSKYADKFEASLANMTANLSGTVTKTCEDVLEYFGPKYEANPDEALMQDLIYKLLLSKKCTDLPIFEEILTKRVESDPTPKSAYALGLKMKEKNKYNDAVKYLKLATELEEVDTVKADYMLALASAYKSQGASSSARAKALEAASLRPEWGDPYIFLGDLYAASARSCADEKLGPGVVYWVAVDMYIKARSVDAQAAERANSRIGKYSASFPDNETLFFNQMKEGDSYTVGCWIQRSTTMRVSK